MMILLLKIIQMQMFQGSGLRLTFDRSSLRAVDPPLPTEARHLELIRELSAKNREKEAGPCRARTAVDVKEAGPISTETS